MGVARGPIRRRFLPRFWALG
ncbi:hypothetical protein CCACVL1_20838 [Corchorus capsularis]|uniref:Uncharacterized protein n=1 Tax=Corchorus capsularis TaxID=210143 RepID=A0A1R3H9L6_COCAP|nr:hypothetical protein CCACVL1_20838 [Corchorus capsularis]